MVRLLLRMTCIDIDPFTDDIYGASTIPAQKTLNTLENGKSMDKRVVTHLSLCDSLPGYGSINDMTFALSKFGVSPRGTEEYKQR